MARPYETQLGTMFANVESCPVLGVFTFVYRCFRLFSVCFRLFWVLLTFHSQLLLLLRLLLLLFTIQFTTTTTATYISGVIVYGVVCFLYDKSGMFQGRTLHKYIYCTYHTFIYWGPFHS